ncbi:MAG: shikimate dehydrogenase [Rubellimicrobium sp.]|nr:shikimate dehydrogenase [Rubellimicrobium sp.]
MSVIPLAGVLGHPVAHSLSPRLHGHWLARYAIPGHYVPLDVAPGDLAAVLAAMPRMGFRGCNVTIPHKQAVLALAAQTTERARRIGAANTLTFLPGGGFVADNTDGYGFAANLVRGAPAFRAFNARALVLGAGGAARAVLDALIEAGVARIALANRTRARADDLAAAFGPRVTATDWDEAGDRLAKADLVVNTTALGMTGQPPLNLPLDGLHAGQTVTDLVYAPLETPLLAAARAAGATVVDGLGMLLDQAAPGFEAWFGRRPEVDDAARAAVLA